MSDVLTLSVELVPDPARGTEVAPKMLTRFEAEAMVARMKNFAEAIGMNMMNYKRTYVRFVMGQGWRALGYRTIQECIDLRFPWSKTTFWNNYDAIRMSDMIGLPDDRNVPTDVLLPLKDIPPERVCDVWHAATKGDPEITPTRHQIEAAIIEVKATDEPVPFADIQEERPAIESSVVGREPGDDDGPIKEWIEDDEVSIESEQTAWVDSLPLVKDGSLSPHLQKRYVADALGWRALSLARKAYHARLKEEVTKAKKECHVTPKYLARQVYYTTGIRGPMEWVLCKECQGSGRREVMGHGRGCDACDGNGYQL